MKISSLNHGIDSVRQGYQPLPIDGYPSQKQLPPEGHAVTDHVALLYPVSKTELLLEGFARPVSASRESHSPTINSQVFDALLDHLSEGTEGSAMSIAHALLKRQKQDLMYLLASQKNLVHA